MNKKEILAIKNGQSIELNKIGLYPYDEFSSYVIELLSKEENHCSAYYAIPREKDLQFIMAIADDKEHDIKILSHILKSGDKQVLESLTAKNFALHIFEREIHENYGIEFTNHPWLKPVRFPYNRFNQDIKINDYHFYSIESEELHEVGVGPIHAGIIEPGHFRFICNGERVLHLEIQSGWQHRGIEQLFLDKKKILQRNVLSENIAGDTVAGHTTAFTLLMEAMAGIKVNRQLQIERT
ncbi:MAG: NADH-quinone oxidoreductase subunit C, partial [Bacteroidota bacterium]